jgi:hypothetical protein
MEPGREQGRPVDQSREPELGVAELAGTWSEIEDAVAGAVRDEHYGCFKQPVGCAPRAERPDKEGAGQAS